jgi:hypothetical protein
MWCFSIKWNKNEEEAKKQTSTKLFIPAKKKTLWDIDNDDDDDKKEIKYSCKCGKRKFSLATPELCMVFCAVEHERVAFAKKDIRNFANAHCMCVYTLLLTLCSLCHPS